MTTMKTLDRHFLANNPTGDQKADLATSVTVPQSVDVPDNPDGTRPKITLAATGDTYADILLVLSKIHDDKANMVLEALANDVVTDEEMAQYETLAEAAPLLKERTRQVVTPFRTFSFGYELSPNDESQGVRSVDLELTTPSVAAGVGAVYSLTKPVALTNLAISLCPRVDDDGDEIDDDMDGEEVLVRA